MRKTNGPGLADLVLAIGLATALAATADAQVTALSPSVIDDTISTGDTVPIGATTDFPIWQLGGIIFELPPPRQIVVCYRGPDQVLYLLAHDGTAWQPPKAVPGASPGNSTPSAASWGPGRLDLFYANGSKHMMHKSVASKKWTVEEDLSGMAGPLAYGPPAAASASWGRWELFMRSNQYGLIRRGYDQNAGLTAWSAPATVGNSIGKPSTNNMGWGPAVAARDGGYDLFYTSGAKIGSILYRRYVPASGWGTERELRGNNIDSPGAVSLSPTRVAVFRRHYICGSLGFRTSIDGGVTWAPGGTVAPCNKHNWTTSEDTFTPIDPRECVYNGTVPANDGPAAVSYDGDSIDIFYPRGVDRNGDGKVDLSSELFLFWRHWNAFLAGGWTQPVSLNVRLAVGTKPAAAVADIYLP